MATGSTPVDLAARREHTAYVPGSWPSLQVSGTPSPFVPDDLRPLAGRLKEIRDANNYRAVSLRDSRAAGVHLRKWPNRA
jgi:hypothetical protein